jgi:transcriptional regulator with XRE-family HTH domain
VGRPRGTGPYLVDPIVAAATEYRRLAGLTQADVADLAGMRFQRVSAIECGHCSPRLSTLRRYVEAVGLLLPQPSVPTTATLPLPHTPAGPDSV